MNRFFLGASATFVAILTCSAAINYFVDVSGVYRSTSAERYAREYAGRLLREPYGLRAGPLERAIKLELARETSAPCYVLGSSHELGVALERMPTLAGECNTLVNLAVSGGAYQDVLTQLAVLSRRAPTRAIIGLGPWFFLSAADSRWTELEEDYATARNVFRLPTQMRSYRSEKWRNLINLSYLNRNLELLSKGQATSFPSILPVSENGANLAEDEAYYRPDGSLIHSRRFRADVRVSDIATCYDYKVRAPFIEEALVNEFRDVIGASQKMGIEVQFLLMPYHPGIWNCQIQTGDALHVVEKTVRDLARQLSAKVIGSYDAKALGLRPSDFDDYMHINHGSIGRVFLPR